MVAAMKKSFFVYFSFVLLIASSFSLLANDQDFKSVKSQPEELSALQTMYDFLIGGVVSPITGHPCLSETDLIAKGAEEIELKRVFLSPYIPTSFHKKPAVNEYVIHKHFSENYKGWVNFPHTHLTRDCTGKISLTTEYGASVEFNEVNGSYILDEAYGVSNLGANGPSGKNDLRNISFSFDQQLNCVIVSFPDGTIRYYFLEPWFKKWYPDNSLFHTTYRLEKEVRPNGKVWHFSYDEKEINFAKNLIGVQSTSPDGQIIYASITIDREPVPSNKHKAKDYNKDAAKGNEKNITQEMNTVFTTNCGQTASYQYEILNKLLEHKKERFKVTSPPILKQVNSPNFANKKCKYSANYLLNDYETDESVFACSYKGFVQENHLIERVYTLSFPGYNEKSRLVVHTINYDPAVAGKKRGITTVVNSDGTSIVYHITENLLIDKIQYLNAQGGLCKQKVFHWDSDNRCRTIDYCDGNQVTLCVVSFEFDKFGNPVQESILGDITGEGGVQSKVILRNYSQDGRNLLLMENIVGGVETRYQYLPGTNLITQKLSLANSKVYKREIFSYDNCFNLIEEIVDDGTSENSFDLSGVTQRTFKRYHLRMEAPFIHMPEWIMEGALENGNERILKKTYQQYDVYGNVCQEDIYDADQEFVYSIYKTFNDRGDLLSETNPLGQRAEYTYDKKGNRITEVPFSQKQYIEYAYNGRNRLVYKKITGTDGKVHKEIYAYDQHDRLRSSTDYLGNAIKYSYHNFSKKVSEKTLPYCLSEVEDRVVKREIHGQERRDLRVLCKEVYDYDIFEGLVTKIDGNLNQTNYTNNIYGSPLQITHPNQGIENFRYDLQGRLIYQNDQEGNQIDYRYDAFGRMLEKKYTYRDGSTALETYEYNSLHLIKETDREGYFKIYTYDFAGRKSSEEYCGKRIEWNYDALGRVKKIIKYDLENALVIEYQHDLADRVLQESKSDLEGNLLYCISYTYDVDDCVSSKTRYIHGLPVTEFYNYDSYKRVILHQDACGAITTYDYNENFFNPMQMQIRNLQKTTVDPENNRTVDTYDAHERLIRTERFDQNHQQLSAKEWLFDACGNLLEEIDWVYSAGNLLRKQTIKRCYSCMNLVEKEMREDARTTCFTYTPSGLLESKILPNGVSLNYSYTQKNLIDTLTSSDNSIHHSFRYDKKGNLLFTKDHVSDISVEYELDAFGNVLKETFSTGLEINKTYDQFNRVLSTHIPRIGSAVYNYDPLFLRGVSRFGVNNAELYRHEYTVYDLNGNLLEEQLPKELGTISYRYDEKGRPKAIRSPFVNEEYAYSPSGNLVARQGNHSSDLFTYNSLNQLLSESVQGDSLSYAYDSNYNRVQKNQSLEVVNALNELVQQGEASYQYDLNGNLSFKEDGLNESFRYTYDALNRLVGAQSNQKRIKFLYDPSGRCLSRVAYMYSAGGWQETERVNFLYDGQHEIGSFKTNGEPTEFRLLGLYINKKTVSTVAVELDQKPYVAINDFHGNTLALVDMRDQSVYRYQFTAYGEPLQTNALLFNPWAYASNRLDSDLKLINFGKRFYDPKIGRWLSLDPIGSVDSSNLYQYVFNNPHRYRDPDGQFAMLVALPALAFGVELAVPSLWAFGSAFLTAAATTAICYGGCKAVNYLNNEMAANQIDICEEQKKEKTKRRKGERNEGPAPPYSGKDKNNPAVPPDERFKWRGKGEQGSKNGGFFREDTQESLRSDFKHPHHEPHWDYESRDSEEEARLYLDGSYEWKWIH